MSPDTRIEITEPVSPAQAGPPGFRYLAGFGNEFASEAVPGALPQGQNAPQTPPRGLYTEQLSGTAVHRAARREPALVAVPHPPLGDAPAVPPHRRPAAPHGSRAARPSRRPNRLRWNPLPLPRRAGRFRRRPDDDRHATAMPARASGIGVHVYRATRPMTDRVFYDADGELLIVPQQGRLLLRTEFGVIDAAPGEIAVDPARRQIPRRIAGRARRAAMSARTTARCSGCRSWGRSAPTVSPTRAIS